MSTLSIVLLVILVVLIIACVVLYFLGKKAEKKQAEQQEQLDAVAQTVSMLIIDKGKGFWSSTDCHRQYSKVSPPF